jgi:hypothetical protein
MAAKIECSLNDKHLWSTDVRARDDIIGGRAGNE